MYSVKIVLRRQSNSFISGPNYIIFYLTKNNLTGRWQFCQGLPLRVNQPSPQCWADGYPRLFYYLLLSYLILS